MEVVLIANEKGGTAKTTTTVCLANCLTALGYRVLAVDTDPSGNLSAWTLPEFPKKVLYDVLRGECPVQDAIVHTDFGDILPTVKDLAPVPDAIAPGIFPMQAGRKSLGDLFTSAVGKRFSEYILNSLIHNPQNALEEAYDFVLIDSAPADNLLVTNAIVAADSVIIPCEPTSASIDGLTMFVRSIQEAQKCYQTDVHLDGLVFAKFNDAWKARKEQITSIQEMARASHLRLYNTRFRLSASVESSMNNCRPILEYMFQGWGATDAMNFTLEFLASRGMQPKKAFPGVEQDENGTLIFVRQKGVSYKAATGQDE